MKKNYQTPSMMLEAIDSVQLLDISGGGPSYGGKDTGGIKNPSGRMTDADWGDGE